MQPPYGTLDYTVPSLREALLPGLVFVIAIGFIIRDVVRKRRRRT